MDFKLTDDFSVDITLSASYRKAYLSLLHVAFSNNDGRLVLPESEKEGLFASLEFYRKNVLHHLSYPIFDGRQMVYLDSHDPEVLRQVLGLPKALFSRLDPALPLKDQLSFDASLNDDRKNVYRLYYARTGNNWYRDDFKLYCLSHGVFFLYDETKPFVNGVDYVLPVYFAPEHFQDATLLRLYEEAKTPRLAIDFLGEKSNDETLALMESLDCFTLEEKTEHFLNGHQNPKIQEKNLPLSFVRLYAGLLRKYVASLVNVLYDEYSFHVRNQVTKKMSFMLPSRLGNTGKAFAISSYAADMFSSDGKHYAFSDEDRKRIKRLLESRTEKNKISVLAYYAKLGLPYEGFTKKVASLTDYTAEDVYEALPFTDTVTLAERFMAPKRYDAFYSYLNSEKEHLFVYLTRRLYDQGFVYHVANPFSQSYNEPLYLTIQKAERSENLAALISQRGMKLSEEMFHTYRLTHDLPEAMKILPALEEIDRKSANQALREFLLGVNGSSIAESVKRIVQKYEITGLPEKDLYPFFWSVYLYPYFLVLAFFRMENIRRKNTEVLFALDGYKDPMESYEPNLPYPFVSWGRSCYSFRESCFAKPYLCTSEKDALAAEIDFLGNTFMKTSDPSLSPEMALVKRNEYVYSHLGIPENVRRLLDPRKDILSQLPFKEGICHHCLHAEPSNPGLGPEEMLSHYPDWTYLIAEGERKGVFLNPDIRTDTENGLMKSFANRSYEYLLGIDPALVKRDFLPYLQTDRRSLTALIGTCYPGLFLNDYFFSAYSRFLSLGTDAIHQMLFSGKHDETDYMNIFANLSIFGLLVNLYRILSLVYPVSVSDEKFQASESTICFNEDDNPRLPFPHVLLGRVFNAYQVKAGDRDFYFCSCDKNAIQGYLRFYYRMCEYHHVPKDIETPLILSLTGLPYQAVVRYMDYDISLGSIDELFSRLTFRDSICRRCTHINHAAYQTMFTKAFPYKDTLDAEYSFANNAMAHDGMMFFTSDGFYAFRYDPEYHFALDSYNDDKLPLLYVSGQNPGIFPYTFFHMDYPTLKSRLEKFGKTQKGREEIWAYASGVILDTYLRNPNLFYDYFFDNNSEDNFRTDTLKRFSEVKRVRESYLDEVINMILLFLNYLFNELIDRYVHDELHIGR